MLELSIIYHLIVGRQYKLLLQEDIRVLLQLIALLKSVLMDIVVIPYVLAIVIDVMLQALWEHAQMQLQIALVIVMFVVQVIAQQFKRRVLATVTHVLVLAPLIAVQQVIAYVLEIVMSVLVPD